MKITRVKGQVKRFVLRPYRRIPTCYSTYYLSGSVIGKGVVVNLSRTGMRILGEHTLTPGTQLSVRVRLDQESPALEIPCAIVQWVNRCEFGLRIDRLAPSAAHCIAALVHRDISIGHKQKTDTPPFA